VQALSSFYIDKVSTDLLKLSSAQHVLILQNLAKELGPFAKLAFEFPLNNSGKFDIHFNLNKSDYVEPFIQAFKSSSLNRYKEWGAFISIVKEWQQEGTEINRFIDGFFLEFDTSLNNELTLPSLFIKVTSKRDKERAFQLAKRIVESLKGAVFFEANSTLIHQCIFNGGSKSYLSYIGLMLARPEEVLRLNINDLLPEEIIPFLTRNGWQGDESLVLKTFDELCVYHDEVIVSFDTYKNCILPRIGFENFFHSRPSHEPRWSYFFDHLIQNTLCSKESKDFVLGWNKTFMPTDDNEIWHEQLIINTLMLNASAKSASVLKQIPSHTKLLIKGNEIKAKGYVGFGQTWIDKQKKIEEFKIENNNLSNAIDKSINYLTANQQQSGYWKDLALMTGNSDQWVSAYIARALVYTQDSRAIRSAKLALNRLKNDVKENGWSWQFLMSEDADSTAMALLLAKELGEEVFYENHKNILLKFIKKDGSVLTFLDNDDMKMWAKVDQRRKSIGWQVPHMCVVAPVLKVFPSETLSFVLSQQKENGSWTSYWWSDDIYATCYMIKSLLETGNTIPHKAHLQDCLSIRMTEFDKAIQEGKKENVYYLSLLLMAAMDLQLEINSTLIQYIVDEQSHDGHWKGTCMMKCSAPEIVESKDENEYFIVNDLNHNITTATALRMLMQYHQLNLL
jgi:hypothetical protein